MIDSRQDEELKQTTKIQGFDQSFRSSWQVYWVTPEETANVWIKGIMFPLEHTTLLCMIIMQMQCSLITYFVYLLVAVIFVYPLFYQSSGRVVQLRSMIDVKGLSHVLCMTGIVHRVNETKDMQS